MRKILTFLAIAIAAAVAITETVQHVGAVSSNIVISQVYGGGGNSGATYKNDFIELFNRGNSPVSLNGWSVQYASAAGSSWAVTGLTNVTLAPGQYYLVQEAAGTGGTVNLPTPDATGSIAMSATAAKVALVAATTALTGVCPAGVVDLIGYNSPGANGCSEGTTTAALTNTTAAIRAFGGCTDTDNNASDFTVSGAPAPRNTASPLAPCGGGSANPTGSGSATPSSVPAGNSTLLKVTVTPGANPASTGLAVAMDLSTIGGSATQQLFDDGTHGDVTGGDNIFSFQATVPVATPSGSKSLPVTITDAESRTGSASITLTVTGPPPPTAPTGVGAATPNSVSATQSTLLTVTVTPGTNPTSSGLLVTGDLSPIGGSASQSFYDDGTNGDQVAFDNVFSFQATVAAGTPFGATSLPVAITDAQSRAGATTIALAVPPPGAGKVMINEIDADTPGSDTAEFIELYDGGNGNTPLDGLVVVLYDGGLSPYTGNQVYASFDLTGYSTDANGYFVLGNPGVANAVLTFDPGQFGLLQNGPDAVALYIGHAGDFPVGKTVTLTNLLDAVVYGTDDPAPVNLMPLVNAGQKIVNENVAGNSQTQSSQRCPNGMGGFRNTSEYYPSTPTPGTANTCPSARPPSDVVISQIYGGGGNSGAPYQNDYVELYNRGSALVDLSDWSLQYSSATGSSWDLNRQPIGGSIGPGQYYLIQLASGGANGVPLPVAANIVSQINIAAGSGNVALVNSYVGLQGVCPIFDPTLMDLVGYGTADCGEGSTNAPGLSNTTAIFRKSNGATDTDNNANDFDAPTTPLPRRTAPIVELGPAVLTTDPPTNGTDAARDSTIMVTFTEAVSVDNNWFSLTCAGSGAHSSATFAANRGGQDQYITPNDNFTPGEQCIVTIFKDRVHDVDLDDSAPNTDTLPADYSWSFTVATGAAPPEPASVHLTMGNPTAAGTDPLNYLMSKPEFALSYNRDLGRPNWVSWHLSDQWLGNLTRADTFRPDPQVPPDWYRVQSFDFSGSGFDRGHMTPNADRNNAASIPINQATFLMSNMVAQAPANNQGPWAQLESALRDIVAQGNELYIVSGPAGAGGTGSSLDSNGHPFVTTTLANGHVTVPASTWKVALVLPKADGDDVSRVTCSTRTIAVVMPNIQSINSDWTTYLTTVDAVETLTGYNFFSNVPEPYQQCIEAGTNGNNPPLVPGNQTITFPQPADSIYGDPAFAVSATGGASGNPVTFAASGACSSSGSSGATITILAPGSCTITASQAGSVIYNAAPDVARTINVEHAALAASADDKTREYGAADPVFTGTLTGVVAGDDITASFNASDAPATPPGTYPIVVSLNDPGGRLGNYSVTTHDGVLTIVDTTAPQLTLPANITTPATSKTGRVVVYSAAATDLLDGAVGVTCAPASGATFPVGLTTVACSASDAHSNTAHGSFSVTVTPFDKKAPKITDSGRTVVEATSPLGAVVTYSASAVDDVDGVVPVVCTPASGSTFPLGQTTVSCSASDFAGNVKTDTFPVIVRDTTDPEILSVTPSASVLPPSGLMTPVTFSVLTTDVADPNPGCFVIRVNSNVTDIDHNGVLDWSITGPLSVSLEAATRARKDRNYVVTIKCTDASGNSSKEKTTIVVSHLP